MSKWIESCLPETPSEEDAKIVLGALYEKALDIVMKRNVKLVLNEDRISQLAGIHAIDPMALVKKLGENAPIKEFSQNYLREFVENSKDNAARDPIKNGLWLSLAESAPSVAKKDKKCVKW